MPPLTTPSLLPPTSASLHSIPQAWPQNPSTPLTLSSYCGALDLTHDLLAPPSQAGRPWTWATEVPWVLSQSPHSHSLRQRETHRLESERGRSKTLAGRRKSGGEDCSVARLPVLLSNKVASSIWKQRL